MAKGKTRSSLGLAARRQKAFELYARNWTAVEVAREIGVSPDTAARYRRLYEQSITEEARANPRLLSDILRNTIWQLRELQQVHQEAWRRYQDSNNDQSRATFLNTALKALDQRAKVLQLFGVKAEYMQQVALIQEQQRKLIEFMSGALCAEDRTRLEAFLMEQVVTSELDALSTTSELDTR